jgi:parallel beta-helix repeat protein
MKKYNHQLKDNALARHFRPTYRSLRKIQDIFFLPFLLQKNDLPEYSLNIEIDDLLILNESLPSDSVRGTLTNEHKIRVNAFFETGGYEERVKIRYRGNLSNNWNHEKKSWMIEFPEEHLLNGVRELSLFLPYDRGYYIEALNNYRARKLGLKVPEMSFANLYINGKSDKDAETYSIRSSSIFSKEALPLWKSWNLESKPPFIEVETLLSILNNADDDTFRKIIGNIVDLDKFYAWNIINVLSLSNHQMTNEIGHSNLVVFFNNATGRFEFIPYNIVIDHLNTNDFKEASHLVNRILSIPEFRERRNELLRQYIENGENLADDLAFFDELNKKTRGEFFKDSAKLYGNLEFLFQVSKYRKTIEDNFEKVAVVLDNEYEFKNENPEKLTLRGSFSHLLKTTKNIDDFVKEHSQFVKVDDEVVRLRQGAHIFRQTLVIPPGLELLINGGTTIYLSEGVSLVSYSPIQFNGEENKKVVVSPLDASKPWGIFAIINASKSSNLDFVEFSGGSQDFINGITFTGMLAFHNSEAVIKNSSFRNAHGDDAVNIKLAKAMITDSEFIENDSDAIDLDFVEDGMVKNNRFVGNGGDSMDLSWSNVILKDNFIFNSSDKGISIGEGSRPILEGNTISGCTMGIAVKDSAFATISNNYLIDNKIGISLFVKKPAFAGGGTASVSGSVIWGNEEDIIFDDFSKISVTGSIVESEYEGEGNSNKEPIFEDILGEEILRTIGL